ncbi:hypothetical protein I316_03600 [Kwoniella heveanensis BCC8398]|uniref:N-acetyltransferase domain-containing protein n=1 Tax=Kwoniella heveanensis BCC8398 TaxID=1296120 RepID=A0A1B9GU17_9TREE|nr:hypothetical protein I316_03600 [Kwoniella heveanensis BCC8398]
MVDRSPTSPVKSSGDEPYLPLANNTDFRLTTIKESDLEDTIALFNHPDVGKWACMRPYPYQAAHFDFFRPHLSTLEFTAQSLASATHDDKNPPFPLSALTSVPVFPLSALRHTSTGKLVGVVNVGPSMREEGALEIAYDVRPDYQGRGLAKGMVEAVLRLLAWLGVERVVAFCEVTNIPSSRLLTKAGFTQFTEKLQAWPAEKGGGERLTIGFERKLS